MTRNEALALFRSAIPADCGTRNTERIVHHEDDNWVATWSTDVVDPHMPEGHDVIGHAVFQEHYGEVDIFWV